MSITDEIIGKAPSQLEKASDLSLRAVKEARGGIKDAAGTIKGICLLLAKGATFTESNVMKAVRYVAFKKTGDIKYSKNNIDISKLRKSGHVYKVEGNILGDAMGGFDEQCKKYGVKYSAMKDTRGEGKPDYEPSYMVFFEGKDTDTIMHVLQESYKDYFEKQEKEGREADQKEVEKGEPPKRTKDKGMKPEERESVKAKLAFFRDRVTARDAERGAVEKEHRHDDISR